MVKHTHRKTGFTLVEILIVVIILGILAAIVIPQFTNASEDAKGSNLISQLQTLRSQLELYQLHHNGDYPDLSMNWDQMTKQTDIDGSTTPAAGVQTFGPYLQQPPENPFELSTTVSGDPTTDGTAAAGVCWVWEGGIIYAVMETTKYDGVFPGGNTNIKVY
jgi:general secretion pathway protein G